MDLSRFCITGLPRSRTAWLAALFTAHGIETVHEYPPFFGTIDLLGQWLYAGTPDAPHGYVDGFAAIYHPDLVRQHFAANPVVVIHRNPAEVRRSWQAWDGPITDDAFMDVILKFDAFNRKATAPNFLHVNYSDLDSFETVDELVIHCTGRPLKRKTWELFHLLKIELHKSKCRPMACEAA